MSLFDALPRRHEDSSPESSATPRPLAERMRPRTQDEFIGQTHLLAPGKPLRVQIDRDQIGSMILWGPPGCGKTTLARLIAGVSRAEFVPFSAVLSGIREIKDLMVGAERSRHYGKRTILFVDEVHRFNKAQQDAFLPHVEAGTVIFIGATTENPSFEVIAPLLSRTRVYVLKPFAPDEIVTLLRRALADSERGLGAMSVTADEDVLSRIAVFANGDARTACNILEAAALGATPVEPSAPLVNDAGSAPARVITPELLDDVLQRKTLLYDKSGEEHFNLISALHKSVRNSDADASLYWLGRMLESGEDALYIARRLVRMASEDIGLADPNALPLTLAAMQAVDFLGAPEGHLALAEAAVYLALAPKSNALYTAYGEVQRDVQQTIAEPVPLHLRNAVTQLMRDTGYGAGYQYAHDFDDKTTGMDCLPPGLAGRRYYLPTDQGLEQRLRQRIEHIRGIQAKEKSKDKPPST